MSESQERRVEKTSTEMKAEYLNKTLQIYKNKSKQLYEKNQELIK